MGSFTAISDVGRTLQELLRINCCPSVVDKKENIGVCSPDETGGFSVGIYLYDIEENTEIRTLPDIMIDESHIKQAPSVLNLSYMIFVSLKSDITSRSIDEQRIIGRIWQIISDNRVVSNEFLCGTFKDAGERIAIELDAKPFDEKVKVWSAFNLPPKTCVFCKVSAVQVESTVVRESRRVTSADISLRRKGINYAP